MRNANGMRTDIDTLVPAGAPSIALARLMAGNERFRTGKRTFPPYQEPFGEPQAPYATLLTCADSRAVPEIVFDEGLGQLFVCRVAGNSAADIVTGSLEFAVAVPKVPLLAVVGHSECAACSYTLEAYDAGRLPDGSLAAVVRAVVPAVRLLPPGLPPQERMPRLVALNAELTAKTLAMDPVIHRARVAGTLGIVWGVHDLASGEVRFAGLPPVG